MRAHLSPLAGLALALLLGACAGSPDTPSAASDAARPAPDLSSPEATADAPQGCRSAVGDALAGKVADEVLVERLRRTSGAQRVRVVHPRDIITMDYDSQRLNLHTDDAGVIKSASCG